MKDVFKQLLKLRWEGRRTENPELVRAQFAALSRLIPLMYFILVANAWVLAATFRGLAPLTHTVYAVLALTLVSALRLLRWWKQRHAEVTAKDARHELRRTNLVAALLCVAFLGWGFALFPYGDAFAKAHVAFYISVSMLSCMFCLIHTRPASLIIGALGGTGFVVFFASTGVPVLVGMATNVALVAAAAVVVVLIQNRDFAHMVNARTESRRRELEQARLLRMIDDMPVAVMTVNPRTFDIDYVNKTSRQTIGRIEHLLPVKASELVGTSIDVFHRHPEHQRRILANPANLPHRTRITVGPEVLDLQVTAISGADGSYLGPMLTWAIVTKEVEAERQILQLAHHDTLTGLPNRTTFQKAVETALSRPDAPRALLLVDLDGFKTVNDTRGHRAGDELLRMVAARLAEACSAPDVVLARLGGDEFAVLLPDNDRSHAESLAAAVVASLSAPYTLDGDRQVRIGASIGIALASLHGQDGETLMLHADMALYAAKAAGRGAARVFSHEMETRAQDRLQMEHMLREALKQPNRLFVFYQPIVDVASGRITAREALLRWHDPVRGWIPPSEFVPVAEGSALIDELGMFVLERACMCASGWTDAARVAVNVSASQLGKGKLVEAVQRALAAARMAPVRLELEITETALMNREAEGIAELRQLRDMGVRIALDDFGTGYSSLAHLRAFPFDKIKIDGSFVRDSVHRPDCAAVVRAVAELGSRLGVTTVAEGVETASQLQCVRQEGCTEVQGYLFGRPAPDPLDAAALQVLNEVRHNPGKREEA